MRSKMLDDWFSALMVGLLASEKNLLGNISRPIDDIIDRFGRIYVPLQKQLIA